MGLTKAERAERRTKMLTRAALLRFRKLRPTYPAEWMQKMRTERRNMGMRTILNVWVRFRMLLPLVAIFLFVPAAQAQHQVVLNWTASTSTGVTGYNIYRLASACPSPVDLSVFTKITTTPVNAITYTDALAVATAGSTFCYAATAVAPGGESGTNGTVQVYIPLSTTTVIPVAPGPFGVVDVK